MKKIQFLSLITLILLTSTSVMAQSTTPASSSAKVVEQGIEKGTKNIIDKVASAVAELRKKNPKAISGVVSDNVSGSFKVKSSIDAEYSIKIDQDLTKSFMVSGAGKKDLKLSDIKKGAYVIVTGPIADKTITANFIYQDEQYLVKTGKVTEVNADGDFVKVLTSDKDTYTLDIETSTKIQILDSKTLDVVTSSFSKMKEGDTVHFVVKKTGDEKEPNRYSAEKILIIPQEYFIK